MKVTATTRRALAFRREALEMQRAGYEWLEPWRLARGDQWRGKIVSVKAGVDGKRIYYKVEGA